MQKGFDASGRMVREKECRSRGMIPAGQLFIWMGQGSFRQTAQKRFLNIFVCFLRILLEKKTVCVMLFFEKRKTCVS